MFVKTLRKQRGINPSRIHRTHYMTLQLFFVLIIKALTTEACDAQAVWQDLARFFGGGSHRVACVI